MPAVQEIQKQMILQYLDQIIKFYTIAFLCQLHKPGSKETKTDIWFRSLCILSIWGDGMDENGLLRLLGQVK